jgi:hypothetical protein
MGRAIHRSLLPHPDNPARLRHRIDVTLSPQTDGSLALGYALHGPLDALCIPTPDRPAPADALWRTTCCELFVAAGDAAYREFNFSPSGQWAACDFSGYRERAPQATRAASPVIDTARTNDALRLDVVLPPAALPAAESMRIAVSAVLEANDGGVGWFALAHPPGKPDFHHRAGFALTLGRHGFLPVMPGFS